MIKSRSAEAKTFVGASVKRKSTLGNTERDLSLLVRRTSTRKPITAISKMDNIQKTLEFMRRERRKEAVNGDVSSKSMCEIVV